MSRNARRPRNRNRQEPAPEPTFYKHKEEKIRPLRALNAAQKAYINSINANTLTFGIGSPGTGKSYIAGAIAADLLKDGLIEKLIITRPGVEAGEKFGFIPGSLEEKFAPFIEPFTTVLNERLGRSQVQYFMKSGKIQATPLAFMRGTNFNDCFVVLDEAQNTTPAQMYLFLTRIGTGCKVVIDGDIKQKDVAGLSGLLDAVNKLENINSVGVVEFEKEDCVRSGLVREILFAYNL